MTESKRLTIDIVDSIGSPLVILDVNPDFRFSISVFNKAAKALFGVSPDDLYGKDLEDLANQEENDVLRVQQQDALTRYKQIVSEKETLIFEDKRTKTDGSNFWARHTLAPVFDQSGGVHQILISSIDISVLVETQKNLRENQKLLEEALTKTLSGYVRICAKCKAIHHNDEWQAIEKYASEKMDYHDFSHGICNQCSEKLYGEFGKS